jgi:hypothetical protein
LEPLANQGLKTVNSNALPLNFFALVEISWVFRLEAVLKLLRRKVTFSNNFASAQCGRILRTLGGIDVYTLKWIVCQTEDNASSGTILLCTNRANTTTEFPIRNISLD